VSQGGVAALLAAQNTNGGWGARAGVASSTESTALAVCALRASGFRDDSPALERGLAWLRSRQHGDGSWPMGDQVPDSSWMSAVAVVALTGAGTADVDAVRGAEWLLGRESRALPWLQRLWMRFIDRGVPAVDQDSTLTGWPWTAGTTAWVEPTAWSLLALKGLRQALPAARTAERIRLGELMLEDRMCHGGGWNYGNRMVMGEELQPYPDTTALALIALHDRPSDRVSAPSLARLRRMVTETPSGLVLALATLSLQLYGEDVSALRAQLHERFRSGPGVDDVRALALMLLALDDESLHFRVNTT
jgi:hypothetical protein